MLKESIFITLDSMKKHLLRMKPTNILVLQEGESNYIKECQKALIQKKIITMWSAMPFKVAGHPVDNREQINLYREILNKLPLYDVIIIPYIPQSYDSYSILELLSTLLNHVIKAIFLIEPINKKGVYHERLFPTLFNKLNYKYSTYQLEEQVINFYMFSPAVTHPILALDEVPELHLCKKKFKVGYWLPHTTLTGGLKTFLEQIRQMKKRGHEVIVYRRGEVGESVLPKWCDLDEKLDTSKCILITKEGYIDEFIEDDIEFLIIASIAQLRNIRDFTRRPIILWEKGFANLFGEFSNLSFEYRYIRSNMEQIYSLPIHIFSVSPVIQEILKYRYGRNTFVLPNGINTDFYKPNYLKIYRIDSEVKILLIGNPDRKLKGFELSFKLLDRLFDDRVSFNVQWISQKEQPKLQKPYKIEYSIAPTQRQLAQYYRNADILLSTSVCEAFSMPPLEAMASGIAVVATNNGGIMSYGENGKNAMICSLGDEEEIYDALYRVATDRRFREQLGKEGRNTALLFDYNKVVERLECLLYSVYCYWYKAEGEKNEAITKP